MKSFYIPGIIAVLLLAGCDEDDQEVKLSARELLLRYDWIVFSAVNQNGNIPDGEPELSYNVFSFEEENYSGSDFTGTFYELGSWNVEEDLLTLGSKSYPILSLTKKELVYIGQDNRIVTRLAIKHVARD